MSSESTAYEVIENQRRIERARAQAWKEARSLEDRARSLLDRGKELRARYGQDIESLGNNFLTQPAESCGLPEIDTYVAALQAHCTAVEEKLSRAIASAETRRLLAVLAERGKDDVMSADELFMPPTGHMRGVAHAVATKNERKDRENEVTRILSVLSRSLSAEERKEVGYLAAKIIQAPSANRAEALALQLRLQVQQSNERARRAAENAQRAAKLRARLWGLEGDDVDSVNAELVMVEQGGQPLTDALLRRVEEVEKMVRDRTDQQYVAEVIREELTRLGYDVEDTFATLWVKGGQAYLRKPELREYRVVMRVEPETARLDVRLARIGRMSELVSQQQKLRDHETENALCHDLAQLRELLRRRQIASRLLRRAPAGSQPIQIIEHEARERRRDEPAAMRRK